jgi:hypothetical protein
MDTSVIAIIVSSIGVLVIVLDKLLSGSWRLSGKLAEIERGLKERQDIMSREIGETVAGMREKVREVELFVRDHYIEKNDFIIQMQHHNEMISMNFTNITARLDRMEKKLDQKT